MFPCVVPVICLPGEVHRPPDRVSPGVSWLQNSLMPSCCACSCDVEITARVYVCHNCALLLPIFRILLDNAQRVDPDEWDTQASRYLDGILERARHCFDIDPCHSVRQRLPRCDEKLFFSPAVAQRDVASSLTGRRFDEPYLASGQV